MAEEFQTTFDRVSGQQAPAVVPNVPLLQLIYGFAASPTVYVAAKLGPAERAVAAPPGAPRSSCTRLTAPFLWWSRGPGGRSRPALALSRIVPKKGHGGWMHQIPGYLR